MCLATVFPYSLLRTNDNTTQADAMLIYKAKSGCKYIHTHTHTLKMLFNQCKSVSVIPQMLKCIPSIDTCTLNVRVKQLLNTREGKDTL